MKKIIVMLVAVTLTLGAMAQSKTTSSSSSSKATTNTTTQSQSKNSSYTTITIQTNASNNCKSCVNRFKENVPFFKGVKEYTFDSSTAKLTVTYDPKKTTADQIRKQISNLGYDADKVKANEAARAKLPPCCRKESCGN